MDNSQICLEMHSYFSNTITLNPYLHVLQTADKAPQDLSKYSINDYMYSSGKKKSHIVLVVRPCDEYMASFAVSLGSVSFKR